MPNLYIESLQMNEFDGKFTEELSFANGLNIISGENGTGKTKTLISLKSERARLAANPEGVLMKTKGLLSDEDFLLVKVPLKTEIEAVKGKLESLGHIDPERLRKAHRAFDLAGGIDEIFRNGSTEEKKEALSEIGSNLTLKGKKLSIYNAEMYETIINGLLSAKAENPRFEPAKIQDTSSRNEDFAAVRTTLLRR